MDTDREQTPVIFRTWFQGEVIALFPELAGTRDPYTCLSYQHTGQHGAADYAYIMRYTKPASHDQYASLLAELSSLGYNLRVVQRESYKMFTARRLQAGWA